MFYAALIFQALFFIYYLFAYPVASRGRQTLRILEAGAPLAGLVLGIHWIIELSIFAYGLIIWETIMTWVMPSFPIMYLFSLKNLITGKIASGIKNIQKEDTQITFEKPTTKTILLILLAAIAFLFTLLYFLKIEPTKV